MSRKRELQKQLGSGYIYERYLDERSLRQLKRQPPEDFSEMVIAALTVGCLRLNAVLYRSDETLIQGYDVLVKDDPSSPDGSFTMASLTQPALKRSRCCAFSMALQGGTGCPILKVALPGWMGKSHASQSPARKPPCGLVWSFQRRSGTIPAKMKTQQNGGFVGACAKTDAAPNPLAFACDLVAG
jgi:hypothetical protein